MSRLEKFFVGLIGGVCLFAPWLGWGSFIPAIILAYVVSWVEES